MYRKQIPFIILVFFKKTININKTFDDISKMKEKKCKEEMKAGNNGNKCEQHPTETEKKILIDLKRIERVVKLKIACLFYDIIKNKICKIRRC